MNSDLSKIQCDAGKQLHTLPLPQGEENKTEGLWRGTLIARACTAYSWEIKIQGSSLILKAHIAFISYYWCLKCMHICIYAYFQVWKPTCLFLRGLRLSTGCMVHFPSHPDVQEGNQEQTPHPLSSLLTLNTSLSEYWTSLESTKKAHQKKLAAHYIEINWFIG